MISVLLVAAGFELELFRPDHRVRQIREAEGRHDEHEDSHDVSDLEKVVALQLVACGNEREHQCEARDADNKHSDQHF
jgi:hypothetical protein